MSGLSFGSVKGSAAKSKADQYKFVDGENSVRLFGNILARYVYWIKGTNGKPIPMECLHFNRGTEEFDKAEKDYVNEFFPDLKCSWAYSMMCIDNGVPKVFNFKKKLFDQIMANVSDLGDPTDPENGWILKFKKNKTGPLPINVEYSLQTIKCLNSRGPLTEEEREIITNSKTIEELIPRATPSQQRELLEKIVNGGADETVDEEVAEELAAS